MKRARMISLFVLLLFLFSPKIYAGTPLKTSLEIKDEHHLVHKIFELKPDEDTQQLQEDPFELDGFSYTYFDTQKEEIPSIEKRTETKTATVTTNTNDAATILQQFAPELDYDQDGFKGKLALDHSTVQTKIEGYTTKTYTITDSITMLGLSNNDPAEIPKSTVKNGVTLKLQNIDWTAQEVTAVDYNEIPTSYKAVASYSGTYSEKIPTGYVTTAEYKGEVSKVSVEKVIYTLTYLGEKIPQPVIEPEKIIEEVQAFPWWVVALITGVIGLGAVCVLFLLFFYNTFVYLKDGDEYQLVARRRIKWINPIVDLTRLRVEGKEVAIHVKKQIAQRLFGRQIKTIAEGDFIARCLVDKQNSDFWYVVSIPEVPEDMEDRRDMETTNVEM